MSNVDASEDRVARESHEGRSRTSRTPLSRTWLDLAPLGALVVFLVFAVRADLGSVHAGRAVLVVTLTQVLPGVLIWRSIRAERGWWLEDIVAGFGIGACIAVGAQVLAGVLQTPILSWMPGLGVAAVFLGSRRLRRRWLGARRTHLPVLWNGIMTGVPLLLLIPTQRFYGQMPIAWADGFRQLPIDAHFHLALTGQLAYRGPTEIPWVVGESLSYHWFSHAWVAQISTAGSVPLDETLFRFGPPVLAVLLVFAIAMLAVRLTDRPWAGPLAGFIALGSADINVFGGPSPFTSGQLLTPVALSLGFSSILLVILVSLLVSRWRLPAGTTWGSSIVVVFLATGAAGAKGSALPIVVAGVVLALVATALLRTGRWRPIALDLALLAGVLTLAFLVLFGGSARGALDPAQALSEAGISAFFLQGLEEPSGLVILFGGLLVAISVLARSAGIIGAFAVPELRRRPIVPLLAGAALAGTGAVLFLTVAGKSQYYFLRNAVPLMAVASAFGLVGLWGHLGERRGRLFGLGVLTGLTLLVIEGYVFTAVTEPDPALVRTALIRVSILSAAVAGAAIVAVRTVHEVPRRQAVAAVVGTALVLVAVVPTVLGELRDPFPTYASRVEPTDRFAVSADQIEAARWLRDHSDAHELVMTNRHCTSPVWVNCDSRRFAITAYTERRVLVEGWAYTRSWARTPADPNGDVYKPFWDQDRKDLNDTFMESPDDAAAEELYERGVRWIYVDKTDEYSEELSRYAVPRYETEWAWILELERPAG